MERLEFDLLFRWFVGIGVDDAAWDHSTFSKNRDRLLEGDIAAKFLSAVLAQPRVKRLLSTDHFSVDGTLIEAWASMKSFRPKDGSGEPPAAGGGRNREADFHGQKRSNETHASTTDPEARLYRKGPGKEAKLCFMGHALMENRNGLVVDACLTEANGHAERIAALHMIEPRADRPRPITLGADKAYDAEDFVNELRSMNVTPHVAQNVNGRSSAIDGRTTRHAGYAVSQRIRKRIEEAFGWIKTIAGQERTKFRGRERVGWAFTFAAAAYNLVRLPKLMAAPHERPGELRADRPLADRRGRHLGSRLSRPLRAGDDHNHRSRPRRNRLRRPPGRPRHRIQPLLDRLHLGRFRRNGRSSWRRLGRTSRRRLHRDRVRLPQWRRRRPQSQAGYFFNSLLGAGTSCLRRSSCRNLSPYGVRPSFAASLPASRLGRQSNPATSVRNFRAHTRSLAGSTSEFPSLAARLNTVHSWPLDQNGSPPSGSLPT